MARLVLTIACDAMARVEDDLARVLDALVAAKEDARRSEVKIARLAVERTSLLLELEESKDEVSSLHSQGGKDKEAMEKDYQKALELIFFLWLQMLWVQTQHLRRPARDFGCHA